MKLEGFGGVLEGRDEAGRVWSGVRGGVRLERAKKKELRKEKEKKR